MPGRPGVFHDDALTALRRLPDASIPVVVTDPPYGLANHPARAITDAVTAWAAGERELVPDGRGFLDRDWDRFVPPPAVWDECYRVLKPGGWLACFAGSRTVDLMGISIRLAGFDMREGVSAWIYGKGWPAGSVDLGKALDRAWDGWTTRLKPAHEPILIARKPLDGSITANVAAHGAGALHIGACLIPSDGSHKVAGTVHKRTTVAGDTRAHNGMFGAGSSFTPANRDGRWPTNLVLAHHPDCDEPDGCEPDCHVAGLAAGGERRPDYFPVFRYQGKAAQRERPTVDGQGHPTVKPLDLIRWLVRLLAPPGAIVLDPFAGSGTTLEAAHLEGFWSLGIEHDPHSVALIAARLDRHHPAPAEALVAG